MDSNPRDTARTEPDGDETIASDAMPKVPAIGKYRITRKLGQGGMGEVWLGHHPELDIPVAIKTLPTFLVSRNKGYLDRFIKEARTAARINHPNVVRIYDAGIDDDVNYIVMEFVDGGSVKELMKGKGILDWQQAVDITICIAEALKAAAEFSIIHRDIKPDNIMLDKKGTPKLADLGLAKQMESPDDLSVTAPGSAIGTPNYISPEQVQDAKNVDCRADIYSLGATLYHMATGGVPFSASSSFELMLKHVQEPLPPPKEKNPKLPDSVCAIICKMMAKRPEERYQSPDELLHDLYKLKHGKPKIKELLAGGMAPGARGAEHAGLSKKKILIAAVAVLLIGLMAGIGIQLWPTSNNRPEHTPDPVAEVVVRLPPQENVGKTEVDAAEHELRLAQAAAREAERRVEEEAAKAAAALKAMQAEVLRRDAEKHLADLEADAAEIARREAERAKHAVEEKAAALEAKKREEEAKRRLAEARAAAETARREAEEERVRAQVLARQLAEEEGRRKAVMEAARKAEEIVAVELEKKRRAEEEVRRRAEDEQKKEEEAAAAAKLKAATLSSAPGKPQILPELNISLVPLPAGTYERGSRSTEWGRSADEPRHKVIITREFWIGTHEITVSQFKTIMAAGPDQPPEAAEQNKLPVAPVTWGQAVEFCEKLTEREKAARRLPAGYVYRLPTEAEWEYACRAGNPDTFSFGNANFMLDKYAIFRQRGVGGPAEVGSKQSNDWGLFDMHGNVYEWCLDAVEENRRTGITTESYTDGVRDPLARNGRFRISRGGSWRSTASDCRSAARSAFLPDRAPPDQGFRIVLAPIIQP